MAQPWNNSDVGATYIMAGQSHEWLLKSAASTKVVGTKMQLKAFTDAGDIDTQLVLCKP